MIYGAGGNLVGVRMFCGVVITKCNSGRILSLMLWRRLCTRAT